MSLICLTLTIHLLLGDSEQYREVKLISSSDEEMSSAEENDDDADEKTKKSDESEADSSNDSDSDSSSDDDKDYSKKKVVAKSSPVVDISDNESNDGSVAASSGKGSDHETSIKKKSAGSK